MKSCIAYIDGGSRGNPGVAGCGVLVLDLNRQPLAEISEPLGIRTNNYAEYSALLAALEFAIAGQFQAMTVYADSELLVKQINGLYKVKHPDLKVLYGKALQLISGLKVFSIRHIPREQNHEADRLANLGMDKATSKAAPKAGKTAKLSRIRAVFRNGCFHPLEPVSLPEGARLSLRIELAADDPDESHP